MNFLSRFENQSKLFWIILGFVLIGGVGYLDFRTSYEITLSLFYLIPIFLLTWYIGQRIGIAASIISAIIWFAAQVLTGRSFSHPAFYVWNFFIELSFFFIVVFLLAALRQAFDHEKELSQTDYITGAANSRLFYYLLQMEINRSRRYKHPFTIVYLDIDNFKAVNDQFGHTIGDKVLRTVAQLAKVHIRKTDVLARLGGDEFALLLPETNQEFTRVVLQNIHQVIGECMQKNNWPVTFSTGALTCISPPDSPDEIIKMVDDLMYSVKHSGKDSVKYDVYPE